MKRSMNAVDILALWVNQISLRQFELNVMRKASNKEIIKALQMTQGQRLKISLCYILGVKRAQSAISILIPLLENDDPDIRYNTADALGKIGNKRTGVILFQRIQAESDYGVKCMMASALGATGYEPAIPLLIQLLSDNYDIVRGAAAWALGKLRARGAIGDLESAILEETDNYAKNRMISALEIIKKSRSANDVTV